MKVAATRSNTSQHDADVAAGTSDVKRIKSIASRFD